MTVVEVAAGLVFRDGQLLITQRPAGGHLAGLWEFPGGKREADESFEDCLHRELMEELGIEVEMDDLMEAITHEYPEKTVHVRFFRCAWKQHQPQSLGSPAFRWVNAEELNQFEFPAADARLVERLRNDSKLWG
jgi:8-oxo-dGTP diphosphatase